MERNRESSQPRKPKPHRHKKNYGQIEKEGLALVFAVGNFHRYLLGRRFTLLIEHKPLSPFLVVKTEFPSTPQTVYSDGHLFYMSTISKSNTVQFGQADALSRLIAEKTSTKEGVIIARAVQDVEAICNAVTAYLPIILETVAKESTTDEAIKETIDCVRQDKWPHKRSINKNRSYAIRHSLSLQDDCLFCGQRIDIPLTSVLAYYASYTKRLK
ncbi:unnamed protein product [Heligmosomoides polygyrus]|uniref:RT_RNaseH domain-containing protein n=1 Tax=Heligmosomoides polygyrus TaxID=6339 RepID=A0A183FMS8_HELPZ|nr:unnamed protein product [Heligmosomoides polygyrus]